MTGLVDAALTLPVLAGAALGALFFLVVAAQSVEVLDTVFHEGAHMVVGLLTGLRLRNWEISRNGGAVTRLDPWRWGPARIVTFLAGYAAPPLVGLGGAALLATGRAWPLLWTTVVLLVLTWPRAVAGLTSFVVVLLAAAIGYVAIYGSPALQAGLAAGIVWLLLFSGLRSAVMLPMTGWSDAAGLAHDTLIPRRIWKAAYVAFALYCLWKGVLILRP